MTKWGLSGDQVGANWGPSGDQSKNVEYSMAFQEKLPGTFLQHAQNVDFSMVLLCFWETEKNVDFSCAFQHKWPETPQSGRTREIREAPPVSLEKPH